MKAKLISQFIFCFVFQLPQAGQCQIVKEWIRQKKTQKEYQIQQIAAQSVYLNLVDEGKDLLQSGLGSIQEAKKDVFSLHQLFFKSMGIVNPHLKGDPIVSMILDMQANVVKHCIYAKELLKSTDKLPDKEGQYIKDISSNILVVSVELLEGLTYIMKNDEVQLDDGQRLQRLLVLHKEMVELLAVSKRLIEDSFQISIFRKRDQRDLWVLFEKSGTKKRIK
ncbi:hypothetical protein [Sphingobacterium cellulitidis]|uniref:hypothetical protein n=1 Tax=Sphingobacterium cellulitidis TaxID=1768011 RepID=UPI000B93AAA8|nr:hypothetical protein CHT99_11470 [Sphingobacterium cellulitidis]